MPLALEAGAAPVGSAVCTLALQAPRPSGGFIDRPYEVTILCGHIGASSVMERKINAAAFKARCLALIDEVAESGEPITVTKRGKAKVQIVPVREKPKTLLGATKGTFKILGDIVGPLDEEYDEDREWRNITGQFDDPPARYAHDRVADRGLAGARKQGKAQLRRRPRVK